MTSRCLRSTARVLTKARSDLPGRSCPTRPWRQHQPLLRHRFDSWTAVRDREVLPARPQLEQIAVMRTGRIARLAWVVQAERVVPVLGVRDDLQRAAGRLVVGAAGRAHSVAVAAARIGT